MAEARPNSDPFLDSVKRALEALDPRVYYGLARDAEEEVWDYTVFFRLPTRANPHKNVLTDHLRVAIVREDFVPEEAVLACCRELVKLPGVQLGDDEISYDYVRKPDTDAVVEVAVIPFSRTRKVELHGGQ